MTIFRTISFFELFAILAFIIFYGIYLIRILYIRRTLEIDISSFIFKAIIRTLYFSLFVFALLGPSFGDTTKEVKSVGKDIMICVDLSQSMNASDVPPTRLEKLKFELNRLVKEFSSDRMGLVIFSSEAFVQCPLTYDQSALALFIETLSTRLVPNAGTNFEPPLAMALDKLNSDESTVGEQKSKIIILISDGEDFGENTESVINEIERSNIKLYTLGIGTTKGSRIKTKSGFKTNKAGEQVVTKLNAKGLKMLALRTGGKYFEISDSSNDVDRLISTMNAIEGELRDARKINASDNKYFYFVIAGLILVLIDIFVKPKLVSV